MPDSQSLGEKIAVFDGLYIVWDETVNGRTAPEDVYVYVINTVMCCTKHIKTPERFP
jgi:hypothetical protein